MYLNRVSSLRALPALFALVALMASGGCRTTAEAGASVQPAGPERLSVAVAPAREASLTRTVQVQGALYPREHAMLAAQAEGAVVQVGADFGDSVKAGQVLMRIDPREYQLRVSSAQATLDQTRAKLANSQAQYNRAEELRRNGLIAAQQFDQIAATMRVDEADVESAEKALALTRKKLSDTEIKAPFAGSVQKRMASLGEYVSVGRQLYELIAIDPIKLDCSLPERFVPKTKVGMPVQMAVDARPGASFTGTITRIAPALDEQSRTLLIEAEVPNPEGVLKPGFFAHVSIDLGKDRALFVPSSAILRYAGVARVFIVEGGVVHTREVTTGDTQSNMTEVRTGLKPGEIVVTSGVDRLADGVAVIAKEQS